MHAATPFMLIKPYFKPHNKKNLLLEHEEHDINSSISNQDISFYKIIFFNDIYSR